MADPKAQRLEMETEIASLEEAAKVITLHPATLDPCTETVDALAASLVDHTPRTIGCCWKSFRALVDSVTVHSNGPHEGSQDPLSMRYFVIGDASLERSGATSGTR